MDTLTIIVYTAIVSEMLFVNLSLVDIYSVKKYSKTTTYFWLVAITAVLIFGTMFMLRRDAAFGNGNGLFILAGTVYILPLKLLYMPPLKKILTVLYTSWVYTALAFTLGVQFARLFPAEYLSYIVLAFQTVYYTVSLLWFNRHLRKKYVNIINNITEKVSTKYLYTAFLMYFSLVVVNYTFINGTKAMALSSFILLGILFTYCFYFVFSVVATEKSNAEMSKLSYYDSLTGLPNRNSLLVFYEEYLNKKTSFSLTFIDLDGFKKINDLYGHNDGDDYLYNFARLLKAHMDGNTDVFRLHGDEFILLSRLSCEDVLQILSDFENKLKKSFPNHEFLGFSAGSAEISDNTITLDKALSSADVGLYEAKKGKVRYR